MPDLERSTDNRYSNPQLKNQLSVESIRSQQEPLSQTVSVRDTHNMLEMQGFCCIIAYPRVTRAGPARLAVLCRATHPHGSGTIRPRATPPHRRCFKRIVDWLCDCLVVAIG